MNKITLYNIAYTNDLFILRNRWPKYDEDPTLSKFENHDDHAGNEKDHQDYPPFDDNNYENEISDKVYNWESIGEFGVGKDQLSTSAEVMNGS